MLKKTTLLMVLFLLLIKEGQSQSTQDFNFANTIASPDCRPFQSSPSLFTTAWKPSHGTPYLSDNGQGLYYIATLEANYDANGAKGEGLYFAYNFIKGRTYSVTVNVRQRTGNLGVSVNFANGLTASTETNCVLATLPSATHQEIYSNTIIPGNTLVFNGIGGDYVANANYSYFWISAVEPYFSNTGKFDILSVSITDNCPGFNLAVTPASTTFCTNTSVTLTASGASAYSWSPSTGLNTTAGASVIASPTVSTTYTVTGTQGICSYTATAGIIIPANKPAVSIATNTGSAVCSAPVSVQWTNVSGCDVSNTNATIIKNTITGWGNAGASSTQSLSNSGYAEATIHALDYKIFGLSHTDVNANYNTIQYGIYTHQEGFLDIYESGTVKTSSVANYVAGDKLRISIENNIVKYYKNATLIYTSLVAPSLPLVVDVAMYSVNSAFDNVNISSQMPSVIFTATPTNPGSTPVYQWNVNGVNVGINSNSYTTASLKVSDVIYCTLANGGPCTATSNVITISSLTSFYPNAGLDLIVSVNDPAFIFSGMDPVGGSWVAQAGLTTAGVFTPSAAGVGTILANYVYTQNGCTIGAFRKITITSTPTGATMANAIDAGTFTINNCRQFFDTKNNNPLNGFGNDYTVNSSDDIYYKFTLPYSATMSFSTCYSDFNTYISLLDHNGLLMASNDDNSSCGAGSNRSSFGITLGAGTYYLVAEGSGANFGNIATVITLGGECSYADVKAGTISPIAICKGSIVTIPVTISGAAGADMFTAQLSDPNGSFIASGYPINLGTYTYNNISSNYSMGVIIPTTVPDGSGYRVRVVCSQAYSTSEDNGTNLTIYTSATNQSLSFNTSSYAIAPHNVAYDLGQTNFTMEAWVKLTNISSAVTVIMKNSVIVDSDGNFNGFIFGIYNGNQILLQLAEGAYEYNVYNNFLSSTFPDIRDNQYHHIAITRSGSTLNFYLDGVAKGTAGGASIGLTSSAGITIGNLVGSIDEVRFWNVARSQSTIQQYMKTYVNQSQAGLIGYWDMNEGSGQALLDRSSIANNGYLGSNSTTTDAADPLRSCVGAYNVDELIFDGSNDVAVVAHNNAYDLNTNDFTIESYVKLATSQPSSTPVIIANTNGSTPGFKLKVSTGTSLQLTINGITTTSTSFTSILDNACHHLAVTRTAGAIAFYKDGVLLSGSNTNTNSMTSSNVLNIGSDNGTNVVSGKIDEVRLWNISRDATSVSSNINSIIMTPYAGLIGYWRFGETDGGQTIVDASATGNNGYLGSNSTAYDTQDPLRVADACYSGLRVADGGFSSDSNILLPEQISIYPNPYSVETNIIISGDNDEKSKIQITDMNSRTVFQGVIENNEPVSIGANLASGIYFVQIYKSDTRVQVRKIVKID